MTMCAMAETSKRYLIVGLGLTGLSCARFCQQQGLNFSLCDTRENFAGADDVRAEFSGVELFLGEPTVEQLSAYDELLVSPGISIQTEIFQQVAEQGVILAGDIQLFRQYVKKPVVAITGSNGKSTVTTLVNELINAAGRKAVAGGNLGIPALDLLSEDNADVFVLELSSFQLETTTDFGADVAVILNISPDHMDRYNSMRDYERAKQRIFQGAERAVVNLDDDHTRPAMDLIKDYVTFGLSDAADFGVKNIDGNDWLMAKGEPLLPASELKIKGRHNLANALAALALVSELGIDVRQCIRALQDFAGLKHRCQWVRELNGVEYFNDSKGTNTGSTMAAVTGLSADLEGRLHLIVGGEGKGQNFSELGQACINNVNVIAYGADCNIIARDMADFCQVEQVYDVEQALSLAHAQANAGDIVLFSPACASFDQFKNYQHRGDVFCELVEALS